MIRCSEMSQILFVKITQKGWCFLSLYTNCFELTCNTRKLIFNLMIFTIINVSLFRGCWSIKVNISIFNFRGGYKYKKQYLCPYIYDKYYLLYLFICLKMLISAQNVSSICTESRFSLNFILLLFYI